MKVTCNLYNCHASVFIEHRGIRVNASFSGRGRRGVGSGFRFANSQFSHWTANRGRIGRRGRRGRQRPGRRSQNQSADLNTDGEDGFRSASSQSSGGTIGARGRGARHRPGGLSQSAAFDHGQPEDGAGSITADYQYQENQNFSSADNGYRSALSQPRGGGVQYYRSERQSEVQSAGFVYDELQYGVEPNEGGYHNQVNDRALSAGNGYRLALSQSQYHRPGSLSQVQSAIIYAQLEYGVERNGGGNENQVIENFSSVGNGSRIAPSRLGSIIREERLPYGAANNGGYQNQAIENSSAAGTGYRLAPSRLGAIIKEEQLPYGIANNGGNQNQGNENASSSGNGNRLAPSRLGAIINEEQHPYGAANNGGSQYQVNENGPPAGNGFRLAPSRLGAIIKEEPL